MKGQVELGIVGAVIQVAPTRWSLSLPFQVSEPGSPGLGSVLKLPVILVGRRCPWWEPEL